MSDGIRGTAPFVQVAATIASDLKKQTLRFEIEDSGCGIAPDKHGLLFERFSQASGDTTRKYGGSGLGLSITLGLLKAMNVEIQLESELNKGSKFMFDIEMKLVSKEKSKKLLEKEPVSFKKTIKGRVLVAEDNRVNVMVVKKFLDK